MSRSDFISPTNKQEVYYSDIPLNFDKNPLSNNLAMVTNEQAIKQSLKCLILTNLGERLYDNTIGSDVIKQLFEPNDAIAINTITFAIKNTIQFNETRINLISVDIIQLTDQENLEVTITFTIINNPNPITLSLILKRIR